MRNVCKESLDFHVWISIVVVPNLIMQTSVLGNLYQKIAKFFLRSKYAAHLNKKLLEFNPFSMFISAADENNRNIFNF